MQSLYIFCILHVYYISVCKCACVVVCVSDYQGNISMCNISAVGLNSLYSYTFHVLCSSAIDVSTSILHSSERIIFPVLLQGHITGLKVKGVQGRVTFLIHVFFLFIHIISTRRYLIIFRFSHAGTLSPLTFINLFKPAHKVCVCVRICVQNLSFLCADVNYTLFMYFSF